jgi:uncharacterized protein (DUF2252 family)
MNKYTFLFILIIAFLSAPLASAADTSATRKNFLKNEIAAANASLTNALRTEKYQAMSASAFAFYRATAHLYYKDLQSGKIPVPATWPATASVKTWVQGDFHTQNVGFFDNKDGTLTFDLNDFDESYVAPFYYDTVRCVGAIHLMRADVSFNFSLSEAQDLSKNTFLEEYQKTLISVNGNGNEKNLILSGSALTGFIKDRYDKVKADYTNLRLLDKYTSRVSNVRKFNFNNADLGTPSAADLTQINSGWSTYTSSIASFYNTKASSYWTIKDRAVRLHSGLGSLGNKKYYVLIEGPSASNQDDDLILEIKEEKIPAMLTSSLSPMSGTYNSQFSSHGLRALTANKASLSKCDDHYGTMKTSTLSYLVRRLSPTKYGFDAIDFKSKTDLANYLKYTAQALAYAHARSDNDYNSSYVSYNAEAGILNAIASWSNAKTTMQTLGETYADQVRADLALFNQLRAEGQL